MYVGIGPRHRVFLSIPLVRNANWGGGEKIRRGVTQGNMLHLGSSKEKKNRGLHRPGSRMCISEINIRAAASSWSEGIRDAWLL